MGLVQVKFGNSDQLFLFSYDNIVLKKNLTVIVDSKNRGLLFGTVVSDFQSDDDYGDVLGCVVRVSTKRDYLQHLNNLKDSEKAFYKCREFVKDSGVSMNIIDASYNFDRSQLLFRFVADERVDFRQLARNLGSYFRTRIELRQIGIRDKARDIGGFGACGRLLCCSSFLTSFDSVSINMAKNQGISLNPNKINGVCGRLLCCLKYENEMYSDMKKNLPSVGSDVNIDGVSGKVCSVDVLKNKYSVVLKDKSVMVVDNNGS